MFPSVMVVAIWDQSLWIPLVALALFHACDDLDQTTRLCCRTAPVAVHSKYAGLPNRPSPEFQQYHRHRADRRQKNKDIKYADLRPVQPFFRAHGRVRANTFRHQKGENERAYANICLTFSHRQRGVCACLTRESDFEYPLCHALRRLQPNAHDRQMHGNSRG